MTTTDPITQALIDDEPLLEDFEYEHLPEGAMRDQSSHFAAMALALVENLPRSADRTHALRSLLATKDTAVRAVRKENNRRARTGMQPLVLRHPRLT